MEWTISQVAEQAQVTQDTIRHYEREGLLLPVGRNKSNYRIYNESSLERIRFIKQAQKYGFNLTEVKQLLLLLGSDNASSRLAEVINQKLGVISGEISLLSVKKDMLEKLKKSCVDNEYDTCAFLEYLNS